MQPRKWLPVSKKADENTPSRPIKFLSYSFNHAAALVAVYSNPDSFANRLVSLTVSGGNINTRLLSSVLMLRLVRPGGCYGLLSR